MNLLEFLRNEARFFPGVPHVRTWDHGHKWEPRRLPLTPGALAQAAQGLRGLLEGLQKLPGRGPQHPALGGPAATGLGQGNIKSTAHFSCSGIL